SPARLSPFWKTTSSPTARYSFPRCSNPGWASTALDSERRLGRFEHSRRIALKVDLSGAAGSCGALSDGSGFRRQLVDDGVPLLGDGRRFPGQAQAVGRLLRQPARNLCDLRQFGRGEARGNGRGQQLQQVV